MRDTTILSDIGYLGPNSAILKDGDTQSLIFKAEDSGPWYLSLEENKERQRHNRPTGKRKQIERSKKMLVEALAASGVVLQQQRNHTKKELIELQITMVLTFMKTESSLFQGGVAAKGSDASSVGERADRRIIVRTVYSRWKKKSNYWQGQLTIITLPHPCQLQGLQGRRNSAGILTRDSAWRDSETHSEVSCGTFWGRHWM